MKIKNLFFSIIFLYLSFFISVIKVEASNISKLGVHILSTHELNDAKRLVAPNIVDDANADDTNKDNVLGVNTNISDNWSYVTIPITFSDLATGKEREWQNFFDNAKDLKIIPIVRLTTAYSPENSSWIVPNKKQIIAQLTFLSKLNWPTNERYIIVYNEVNHAVEWGGHVDPRGYVDILKFTSNWAHTEGKNYIVLPAAMDLAAPNGKNTLEAFNYLSQMYTADPEIFSYIDVWNSHSYPNPGFASSPTRNGKNSLRGFQYELNFLKLKTSRDYKVMITETGWKNTKLTSRWLSSYYTYAMQHIWSDDRVLAVTPFLLKGSPGPFSSFSFFDENNEPTNQFYSFRKAFNEVFENI